MERNQGIEAAKAYLKRVKLKKQRERDMRELYVITILALIGGFIVGFAH